MTDARIQELRDSVAFAAGQSYERRRIGELLRQRKAALDQLIGVYNSKTGERTARAAQNELRQIMAMIEEAA